MFPKEDLAELRELARERGISVSELVREELRKKTLRKKRINSGRVLLDAAEWARKNNIKGPGDLGSNDEYLYGRLAPDYPLKKKR